MELQQTSMRTTLNRYATAEIGTQWKGHQPGTPLGVWFGSYFHDNWNRPFHLRQAGVVMTVDPQRVTIDPRVGVEEPYKCRSGIEIKYTGGNAKAGVHTWMVRAPEQERSLNGRNGVPDEGQSLFEISDPKPGQQLDVRLIAFANGGYFVPNEEPIDPAIPEEAPAISRNRQAIIDRLKMRQFPAPNRDGEIVFCETRDFVDIERE